MTFMNGHVYPSFYRWSDRLNPKRWIYRARCIWQFVTRGYSGWMMVGGLERAAARFLAPQVQSIADGTGAGKNVSAPCDFYDCSSWPSSITDEQMERADAAWRAKCREIANDLRMIGEDFDEFYGDPVEPNALAKEDVIRKRAWSELGKYIGAMWS